MFVLINLELSGSALESRPGCPRAGIHVGEVTFAPYNMDFFMVSAHTQMIFGWITSAMQRAGQDYAAFLS
jgi:hypothetical protein